jgi:hypothetical protein
LNRHQRVGVVGLHQVALLDRDLAGVAGHRRPDRAVLQLQPGALYRRLVAAHRGRRAVHVRLDLVVGVGRDEILLQQILVALLLLDRAVEQRPCP